MGSIGATVITDEVLRQIAVDIVTCVEKEADKQKWGGSPFWLQVKHTQEHLRGVLDAATLIYETEPCEQCGHSKHSGEDA